MPPIDTQRFLFSLAGELRTGDWNPAGLRVSFGRATAEHPLRVPGLFTRLLARFPELPDFALLVLFLHEDAGLKRALTRRFRGLPRLKWKRGRPTMGETPSRLAGVSVPSIATEAELAAWLELEPGRLSWLADITGRNRKHPNGPLRTYRHRWVPKPGGRSRLLEIPRKPLKTIQRTILERILNAIPAHPNAHGFRAGRSAVTNAACHCGQAVVIKFDLTDFFPSVSAARVCRIFRTVGYPEKVARLLTGLCTTRMPSDVWNARPNPARDGSDHFTRLRFSDRHLPQGAPTSPALANLAAHRLDRRLSGLAARLNATYTRYADDLTFSGGHDLARRAKRLAQVVAVIAFEEGFSLNFRKTRVMRTGHRQTVTGIVVNARPNAPRAEFDLLKAILTNCVRHGPESQNGEQRLDFRAYLAGKVAHMAAINAVRGKKLWAIFDRIAWLPGNPKQR